MNQRQQHRKFKNGEKTFLTDHKIAILDELGFVWSVGRGKKLVRTVNHPNSRENPIGQLGDELIFSILSFLLDIKDMVSFSSTSTHYHQLVNDPDRSSDLFMRIYSHQYGSERLLTMSEFDLSQSSSWLHAWKAIPKLTKAFDLQASLDEGIVVLAESGSDSNIYLRPKEGIGILPSRKESQAILKDNPSLVPPNDKKKYSSGYGGMTHFYIKSPPIHNGSGDITSSKAEMKDQIAVWGDFEGLRVCNSVEDLFRGNGHGKKTLFHSVGDARFGRVSIVIPAPPLRFEPKDSYHPRRPCLYLGCASGAVSKYLDSQLHIYV